MRQLMRSSGGKGRQVIFCPGDWNGYGCAAAHSDHQRAKRFVNSSTDTALRPERKNIMTTLIGYEFFNGQKQFEDWQLENEAFKVHTVQPNATNVDMKPNEKYSPDLDGNVKWGVFVTYTYPHTDPT